MLVRYFIGDVAYRSLILLMLLLSSCHPSTVTDTDAEPVISLSFKDKARIAKYQKGNLISNPSFEKGNTIQLDSVSERYVIEGWEQIGSKIEWQNYASSDSNNRRYLVIKRKKADETETFGVGVMSDFIRVIPGTYNLTCDLNLIDIHNPQSRIGAHISDAVQLRIFYYDRNHTLIENNSDKESIGYSIDEGFQALSLVHLDKIDSTGWVKIQGRAHNAPYVQGIITPEVKFVRIFIGLKGTGELWIDNMHYSYKPNNISLLERMNIQKTPQAVSVHPIFPAPQFLNPIDTLAYSSTGQCVLPIIIYANQSTPAEREVVQALRQFLLRDEQLTKADVMIISDDAKPWQNILDNHLVIAIGKSQLTDKCLDTFKLPEVENFQNQGYYIDVPDNSPNSIMLLAQTQQGYQYGLRALKQLIDIRKGVIYRCQIVDYPLLLQRGCWFDSVTTNTLPYIKSLIAAGYNQLGVNYPLAVANICEGEVTGATINCLNWDGTHLSGLQVVNGVFAEASPFDHLIELDFSKLEANTIQAANDNSRVQRDVSGIFPWYIFPAYLSGHVPEARIMHMLADDPANKWTYYWAIHPAFSAFDDASVYMVRSILDRYPGIIDESLYRDTRKYSIKRKRNLRNQQYISLIEPYSPQGISKDILQKLPVYYFYQNISSASNYIRLLTALDFAWNPVTYQPEISLINVLRYYGLSDKQIELYLLAEELFNELIENTPEAFSEANLGKQQKKIELILQNHAPVINDLFNQQDPLMTELSKEIQRFMQ